MGEEYYPYWLFFILTIMGITEALSVLLENGVGLKGLLMMKVGEALNNPIITENVNPDRFVPNIWYVLAGMGVGGALGLGAGIFMHSEVDHRTLQYGALVGGMAGIAASIANNIF